MSRSKLSNKLGTDPSLVQALRKQANSAFHASELRSVLRVEDAIDRIGLAATRAIVMASCIDGLLSKPGVPYDPMLSAVWTHMVNTGHLARIIAPSMGADAEESFAVALLHDVGKLVIFDTISALRASKRGAVALPEAWLSALIQHLHESLGAAAEHAIRKGERLDFEGVWRLGQIWGDRSDVQAALFRRVKAA